ncbi:MAG: IS1380 family transposase [Kineosporiaceae bacterium]|nr:IS1380 family transposase [Aeromicrobium sp.]
MQLSHTRSVVSATFDDPNLVSAAGLVPVMRIAAEAGLTELAQEHLSVPTDRGANAGLKVTSLVGGMVAGADSIDDMALLRHGGMRRIFNRIYAPSTLGSFLRAFTFGHVRQLDAVASRFLVNLAKVTPLLGDPSADPAEESMVFVDVDDTIIEVHGHAKQGAGFGYSGVRGLNALTSTVSAANLAPVIAASRLRKGNTGSPRGAARLVADVLATLRRTALAGRKILVRADSAFYGHATISAALTAGADVSVTARMDPAVKRTIASIADDAWTKIKYTNAILDEATGQWVSTAEVAETPFTAFTSRKKSEQVTGRLVVRRIPDLAPKAAPGQGTLFDRWRFHAFFTTTESDVLDTVTADRTHRQHAIIEQVHADLKHSALAHLPSGVFNANAAWLVLAVMTFNLTRATGTICGGDHARATTSTLRRKIIAVPARIASSARKLQLHLPMDWPWESAWAVLFARALSPPVVVPS